MATKHVTELTLFQRLKRWFNKNEGVVLRKVKSARCSLDLGEFFTVDVRANAVVDRKLDLEIVGRQKGILKSNEVLS
ncbi:MAG TPA: hypothetical protein VGN63_13210 [Flavisolibacter sp.]|jgi:hypothetical protein|nr:hypothetical protein [Flavisolibacter sp.]